MLIITVIKPGAAVRFGASELVHHYLTPHERFPYRFGRFERERRPIMPLEQWRVRLESGQAVMIGDTLYRPATLEEIQAYDALCAAHRGPGQ